MAGSVNRFTNLVTSGPIQALSVLCHITRAEATGCSRRQYSIECVREVPSVPQLGPPMSVGAGALRQGDEVAWSSISIRFGGYVQRTRRLFNEGTIMLSV